MIELQSQTNNQKCFVSTLSRLRKSSKDAVVSANFSDTYTMYMHVDRPVQEAFVSILKETYNSDHAELILLCGSVGDGKSHMLSYCREKYPEMMSKYNIHNDSTASFYIDKPASYTLAELMEDYTDEKLHTSNKKVILAINLGTLNNFLEEDRDNRFGTLKKYVEKAGILDLHIGTDSNDKYFHSVNFADYHLYELTKNGPESEYVTGIMSKITSTDENNVFYSEYCSCCQNCDVRHMCPVKANYELLSNDEVKAGLIRVLSEAIVRVSSCLVSRFFEFFLRNYSG